MADFDLTVSTGGQGPQAFSDRAGLVERLFDATEWPLDQNDVAQLMNIPAKTLVLRVFWEVETVEGGARNFSLGDGDDTDGFIASTSANSLASGISSLALTEGGPNTITGYSNGKYYAAADTLDLLAVTSGGLTGAKIRVKVWMYHFE